MRTNEAGVTGSKRGRGAEELAEAVELARAKSKLRASKARTQRRLPVARFRC